MTLFRNILSSDPFPAMLFWGSIWYQLTCFCLVFYWLWKSQPPMKEESRSARGAWLIYSLLYPSHSCLRWWVKMVPELCIYFGREKKKKKGKTDAVVPRFTDSSSLFPGHSCRCNSLDTRLAQGLWTWLRCFGWKSYSPGESVVPPTDGKHKPPLGEPILRCSCEADVSSWCSELLRIPFPPTADKASLIFFKEGDSPTWRVFGQISSSQSSTVDLTQEFLMVPFSWGNASPGDPCDNCFWNTIRGHRDPVTWPPCWVGRTHLSSGVSGSLRFSN